MCRLYGGADGGEIKVRPENAAISWRDPQDQAASWSKGAAFASWSRRLDTSRGAETKQRALIRRPAWCSMTSAHEQLQQLPGGRTDADLLAVPRGVQSSVWEPIPTIPAIHSFAGLRHAGATFCRRRSDFG